MPPMEEVDEAGVPVQCVSFRSEVDRKEMFRELFANQDKIQR